MDKYKKWTKSKNIIDCYRMNKSRGLYAYNNYENHKEKKSPTIFLFSGVFRLRSPIIQKPFSPKKGIH